MQWFHDEVSKPAFWFTAVFVGLLINLAASYAKPLIDAAFGGISQRWANRTKARMNASETRIEKMTHDTERRLMAGVSELRHRSRSITNLVGGVGLFVAASHLTHPGGVILKACLLFGAAVAIVVSIHDGTAAMLIQRELEAAVHFRKRKVDQQSK